MTIYEKHYQLQYYPNGSICRVAWSFTPFDYSSIASILSIEGGRAGCYHVVRCFRGDYQHALDVMRSNRPAVRSFILTKDFCVCCIFLLLKAAEFLNLREGGKAYD